MYVDCRIDALDVVAYFVHSWRAIC